MKGQSYHAKTILEQYDGRKKIFLSFKDSPRKSIRSFAQKGFILESERNSNINYSAKTKYST